MKQVVLLLIISILIGCSDGNNPVTETEVYDQPGLNTDWYTNARFGMFIHWGLYSELAGVWENKRYYGIGEWIMQRARIPYGEYAGVAKRFNPEKFDANDWVLQAKNAGMKYIIITSKHHDGFSMYHTRVSPFNIIDATPFKRDPLKELAAACERHGIKLGFYYSQTQDWYEPNAYGNDWDFDPEKADFDKYLNKKVKPQLTELLTNYGETAILWFDTPRDITPEGSLSLVNWVHNLQPGCLTTSRVGNGYGDYLALGDHQIPDTVINKPYEVLYTHNDSWGYTHFDRNYRSTKEIVNILMETSSKGGNFLLNIGPKPDGTFPDASRLMLEEVGEWIAQNREAVYETLCSPFPELTWGYCTRGKDVFYFSVFDWPVNGKLRIPDLAGNVKSVSILSSGKIIKHTVSENDLLLQVPLIAPDPVATVIKIEVKGDQEISDIMTIMEEYPASLDAYAAKRSGNSNYSQIRWTEEFGDWKYASFIDGWKDQGDVVYWRFKITEPGFYRVLLDYSFTDAKGSSEGLIQMDGQELYFEALKTGDERHHFRDHQIGVVNVETAGIKELSINPVATDQTGEFIQLQRVKLIPL